MITTAKLPLVRGQITREGLAELLGLDVAAGSPLEEMRQGDDGDVGSRFELVEGDAEVYERTR